MNHMNRAILIGTVVLALSGLAAYAQQAATRQGADKVHAISGQSGGDQHFVMEAATAGMAEVELGKLATVSATNDAVKTFGQRMVDDRTKANEELKTLAQSKNIPLPTAIDGKHKATHDRLAKLSGAQFEQAYMQAMVADHRQAVALFQKESQAGKDTDVKAWAAKTLPTLRDHLKQAQDADKAVGTSGTAKKIPKK
jgi:putative membrane protein